MIWPVIIAMVFQTVVLASVNKTQINSLKENLHSVARIADKAHHKIDDLKDKLFEYLRDCKLKG